MSSARLYCRTVAAHPQGNGIASCRNHPGHQLMAFRWGRPLRPSGSARTRDRGIATVRWRNSLTRFGRSHLGQELLRGRAIYADFPICQAIRFERGNQVPRSLLFVPSGARGRHVPRVAVHDRVVLPLLLVSGRRSRRCGFRYAFSIYSVGGRLVPRI
jgi:hypothetical protein